MILAREFVVFNVEFLSYENRKIASASTFLLLRTKIGIITFEKCSVDPS